MSEFEYVIQPQPGISLVEAVQNPKLYNSFIGVFDGRTRITTLTMTDRNLSNLDLKPSPEYYMTEEMRTTEGIIPIEKTVPEFTLVSKVNPFHQIIYAIVMDIGRVTPNTIKNALIKDYRVFPDTKEAEDIIYKILDTMDARAHLLHYVEKGVFKYQAGRELDSDDVYILDYMPGYDPNAWQILDYIKLRGKRDRGQIDDYIMKDIGWITDMNVVSYYLDGLTVGELWGGRVCSHGGNIEKVREYEYVYKSPLEPWGEKSV